MVPLVLAALTFTSVDGSLVKDTNAGFVPPNNQMSETCELHHDRVVVTLFGSDKPTITTTQSINLEGDIAGLLRGAANTQVTREVGPTDGPETRYYGNMLREGDIMTYIDLGHDVSGERTHNPSLEAQLLRRLLDRWCPSGVAY